MSGRMRILVATVCVLGSLAFASPSGAQQSGFTSTPPTINGDIDTSAEWDGAGSYDMGPAMVYFLNDADNLYVLFDVWFDTSADDGPAMPADLYVITFDVDRDGEPDVGLDCGYAPCIVGGNIGALVTRYLLEQVEGCLGQACQTTSAVVGRGFGASPAPAPSHRIWEVAIPLSEIGGQPGQTLRYGLGVYSPNPSFGELIPDSGCMTEEYLTLRLAGSSGIPTLGWWGIGLLAVLVAGLGVVLVRRIF